MGSAGRRRANPREGGGVSHLGAESEAEGDVGTVPTWGRGRGGGLRGLRRAEPPREGPGEAAGCALSPPPTPHPRRRALKTFLTVQLRRRPRAPHHPSVYFWGTKGRCQCHRGHGSNISILSEGSPVPRGPPVDRRGPRCEGVWTRATWTASCPPGCGSEPGLAKPAGAPPTSPPES